MHGKNEARIAYLMQLILPLRICQCPSFSWHLLLLMREGELAVVVGLLSSYIPLDEAGS